MGKIKTVSKIFLIIFLAFVMAFGAPLKIFAETQTVYISEVSVGSLSALQAGGYTVVNADVRGSDSDQMYLGYKTTLKKSEAITDIRALNMYGGYSKLDFDAIINSRLDEISDTVEKFYQAVCEFRINYAKGEAPAKIAYDALNAFYVPGTGANLGEYLIDGNTGTTELTNLVLMSTNVVISYITNMLILGVADDVTSGDSTWLERAVETGPFDFTGLTDEKTEAIYRKYDNEYRQRAYYILYVLNSFVNTYAEALEIYPDGKVDDLDEAVSTVNENENYAVDVLNGDEEEDSRLTYASVFSIMDELNSLTDEGYKYYYGMNEDGTERSFGQYLLQIAETAEDDEDEACRMIYPWLVESNGKTVFSYGQEVLMSLSDFTSFFTLTTNDSPDYEAVAVKYKASTDELLSLNGGERISVWFGTNTEIYTTDKDIYMTGKTARENASGSRFSLMTETDPQIDGLKKSEKLQNAIIITSCVGLGALGVAILGFAIGSKLAAAATAAAVGTAATYATASTWLCALGVAGVVILVIAAIVVFVLFILKDEAEDEESEEEKKRKEFKWTVIPEYIYDYKKYKDVDKYFECAAAYECVNLTGTDLPANLNTNKSLSEYSSDGSGETVSWNVLYTTKDIHAGSPLCVPEDGSSPFIIQYDDGGVPQDYSAVRYFEEKTAGDLNLGENGEGIYIMMHRLDNGVADEAEKGKYIDGVKLCSGSTQDGVIGEIMRDEDEYEVVYCNLTSDMPGVYTYVGYTTTDNPDDAITDLRVAYCAVSDKVGDTIKRGIAEYTICGDVGELILCQTDSKSAGTPILASQTVVKDGVSKSYSGIVATNTLGDAPEGFEPVCLFSGGPAFDFNGGGNWEALLTDSDGNVIAGVGNEIFLTWSSHTYLYFNPETKFTSGEKYLGGLAFFSISGSADDSYIVSSGWTILDGRNLGGAQEGTNTRLCYYETYNPYRAVYDIKFYKAELSASAVPFNINYGGISYTACDVYAQGGGKLESYMRTVRATHSYRSCYCLEGGGYSTAEDSMNLAFANKYAPSTSYLTGQYSMEIISIGGVLAYSKINCVGLYTTGKSKAALSAETPLKLSDIEVAYVKPEPNENGDRYDYTCQTPVRDFRYAYSDYAANLGAPLSYASDNDFYLFIKKPDENYTVPEYVASVTVGYAQGDADGSNTPFDNAIMQLLTKGKGKLYEINLSGNATAQSYKIYSNSITVADEGIHWSIGTSLKTTNYTYNIATNDYAKNAKVAYVWVTYTDIPTDAVSDLVIYETASKNSIKKSLGYFYTETQKKATKTELCGSWWQVDGLSGKYFALYSITHNGHPITDVDVSDVPMLNGMWTSLGFDNKCTSMTNAYIHAAHSDQSANSESYISSIYVSSAATWKEAQRNLLDQGCRAFVAYDTNPSGLVEYIGYGVTCDYSDAYSSFKLVESGQNDTITKAEYGWDISYDYISSDLNSAAASVIIKLFGSKSATLAEINGGSGKTGRYIDRFMFMESSKKNVTTVENGEVLNWNVVTDFDGNPQPLSMGFVGGEYVETSYMYVHYSDNSVESDSLLGSVFAEGGSVFAVAAGGLIVLSAILLAVVMYKKKRA